jgi:hypothetical protein
MEQRMIEFIVIVESPADAQTATKLAERVLLEKIGWLEPELLPSLFRWSGLDAGTDHSCWKDTKDIIDRAKKSGIPIPKYRGHGKTGPLKADGAAADKVLKLTDSLHRKKNRQIKAVLLIRDLDNQPDRRRGLEQAREEHCDRQPTIEIVIGTADRMREAWVLNGFIPTDSAEKKILVEIIKQLSFDPCKEAHRLRSTSFEEPLRNRNPKIVVDKLTKNDSSREQQCWEETELAHLHTTGIKTGLTAYLKEIEQRIAPIIFSIE